LLLLQVFLGAMLKANEYIQVGSIIIILNHNLAFVLMKYLCTWRQFDYGSALSTSR